MRRIIFIPIALLLVLSRLSAQTTVKYDGAWWNQQTSDLQKMYVTGFFSGISDVRDMLQTLKAKKEVVIEKDPITQLSTEVEVASTPRAQVIGELDGYCVTTTSFTVDQYYTGLTDFYKEKLNKNIPINKAFEVVRMYLKGKTKFEINPHVKSLREEFSDK